MSPRSLALLVMLALVPPALAAPPDEATVRLIWFGRTGGVSGQVGRNRAHLALYDQVGGPLAGIEPIYEGPRVFVHGARAAVAPGGLQIATFHRFLAHGPHTREVLDPTLAAVESPFELLVELPGAAQTPVLDLFLGAEALLPGMAPTTLRRVRYTATDGTVVEVLEPADVELMPGLPTDPAEWEIRWAFQAEVTPAGLPPRTLLNIGRPLHDGARRVALIERLVAEAPDRTLVLAAGEDIETFSFTAAGKPDLQRPNTWDAYRRLGLTALAPGGAEAAFGLDTLQRAAQEHEVPVLAANVDDAPFAGWRLVEAGPTQVLVVGLVDPELRPADRRRGFGDRAFADPAAAVNRAVEAARARLGRRPDLVVVFGVLSPEVRARLVRDSGEIDLLLADFADHGIHREALTTALATPAQQAARARERHPLTVASAGATRLGLAEVSLVRDPATGRWQVLAVESQAVPVPGDLPADRRTAEAVQRVRQAVYAPAQVELLPDLGPAIAAEPALFATFLQSDRVRRLSRAGQRVPPRVTAALWRQMVANAVGERLDAEVVLLPPIPFPWALDGPITTLEAVANLNVPDRLRLVKLTAAELRAVVAAPAFAGLVTAGVVQTADGLMVRGRPVDEREVYRVAFADGLVADPGLAPTLDRPAIARFEYDAEDDAWRAVDDDDDEGRALPLRDFAVRALRSRAEADGASGLAAWMHPSGAEKRARWVLDLRALAFEGSLYGALGAGADDGDGYGEVRETRVRTASHQLVAARGDVYFNREGVSVDWVNRLHVEFAKGFYEAAEDQETADDLRLSTELQVPPWTVPVIRGVPFGNLAFASEFTPTEGNDRKKQIEGSLGLLWSGGIVQQARAAALVVHDFASDLPDPQVGALAAIGLRIELPSSVWFADGEVRYFIPEIGVDDASELGVVGKLRSGFDVPLFARLSLGIYVDLFAYRGQVPATHDPGASVISGLSLKYDQRLKLGGLWW